DNRVADVRQIGDRLPLELTVAARALRAALDDVARDCAGGEPVPIVRAPTELVHERRERQPRVACAPRDDDRRAAPAGFDNPLRTEICIRAQNTVADRRERRARIHVAQFDTAREQFVYWRQDGGARDEPEADAPGQAQV